MRKMSLLRALLITDPLVILATLFFGAVNLVVALFDRSGNAQVTVARAWARALLLAGSVHVEVEGLERIAPGGSYVLASNHLSYMDTPVVLANIPVQFRFLAKKGLFKIPFLGGHLKRAGHIPVTREDPRAAVKTMSRAADIIRERNVSILIFPEGGRSREGVLRDFKEGAAFIAIKAGVPLVPIALVGTREVLPMGSAHIRGGKVRMRIGEPILTKGLTTRDRARVTEELRQQIAALLEERPCVIH
jgi:1-acyl-sn-glycerol-3-phosphate acyltransferase